MNWLSARVFHARTRPKRHAFQYFVSYIVVSQDDLARRARRFLVGIDRWNVFSVLVRDYGDRSGQPQAWLAQTLSSFGISDADGGFELVTMPRILGYAFNPVSFWFCFDRNRAIRAVIAEVNNTFGERHCYICFHDDHRPISGGDILAVRKVFHVSPFMAMDGTYRFRFENDDRRIAITIDLEDKNGTILKTSIAGARREVAPGTSLTALFRLPLDFARTIVLIHFEAVRLWLKGVASVRKPELEGEFVSR
jgi:DUF1365 family protein